MIFNVLKETKENTEKELKDMKKAMKQLYGNLFRLLIEMKRMLELKTTITSKKKFLDDFNNRLDVAEERIHYFKDKTAEVI